MRFFLPRRRQCRDDDMAEEGEGKDREKRSKIEGPVCGQSLKDCFARFVFTGAEVAVAMVVDAKADLA